MRANVDDFSNEDSPLNDGSHMLDNPDFFVPTTADFGSFDHQLGIFENDQRTLSDTDKLLQLSNDNNDEIVEQAVPTDRILFELNINHPEIVEKEALPTPERNKPLSEEEIYVNVRKSNSEERLDPDDPMISWEVRLEELWNLISPHKSYESVLSTVTEYPPITPEEMIVQKSGPKRSSFNNLQDSRVIDLTSKLSDGTGKAIGGSGGGYRTLRNPTISERSESTMGVRESIIRKGDSAGNGRSRFASMTDAQKKKLRAERNREYAKQSRLRLKRKVEELERKIVEKRSINRELRGKLRMYQEKLEMRISVIESAGLIRESKNEKLVEALSWIKKAIEKCVWTFHDSKLREVPLDLSKVVQM